MTPARTTTETTGRLFEEFSRVRRQSEELCLPLSPEDMMVQSCAEASPAKWHLAHTTWFFETFLLREFLAGYREFHPDFRWLFNSYYNSVSDQPEKKLRASFSRPPVETIFHYRQHVQDGIQRLLASNPPEEVSRRIVLGLHHEQQHQELLAYDIKHALWTNPLRPAYLNEPVTFTAPPLSKPEWIPYPGGVSDIGFDGSGFAFDNELPRHPQYLRDFELASRLVSCAEYLEFIEDGGYRRPELWLSAGWDAVKAEGWKAPLYWRQQEGVWQVYTMYGELPLTGLLQTPVCHVSYFEADAFANWSDKRLPTEAEWEVAAQGLPVTGNLLEDGTLHPLPLGEGPLKGPAQMFGDVWEWTASPYIGYPGFRAVPGALGEYNGKFMSGQMVLRGGSVVTPASHIRATYRNFFSPATRWQFAGIRLANIYSRGEIMSAISLPKLPASASSPVAVEVLNGLTEQPKTLSPWMFYDEAGSRLFEEITELPEYYVTRTERQILAEHADAMVSAAAGGRDLSIIELGAGTATKTGLLLNAAVGLQGRVTYYPIDVSQTALEEARTRLEAELPQVTVEPIVADYTEGMRLNGASRSGRRLVLYIGSSIGNFSPADAVEVLRGVRAQLLPGDCLLLGTDMVKDTRMLLAAYNDAAGVTARFNLNVLVRMNRELDATFNPQLFRHQARWNAQQSRIEMHLESLLAQKVAIRALDMDVRFSLGETIHTENSYKFTDQRVAGLLSGAGFRLRQQWSDANKWFTVYLAGAE